MQWLSRSALQDAAVSTGVKKVSLLSERVSHHGYFTTKNLNPCFLQIMKLCDSTLGQPEAPTGVRKSCVSQNQQQVPALSLVNVSLT